LKSIPPKKEGTATGESGSGVEVSSSSTLTTEKAPFLAIWIPASSWPSSSIIKRLFPVLEVGEVETEESKRPSLLASRSLSDTTLLLLEQVLASFCSTFVILNGRAAFLAKMIIATMSKITNF
jgi:hypothetical protein